MADVAAWYYADGQQSVGPVTLADLVSALPRVGGREALIFGPNLTDWTEARHVGRVMDAWQGNSPAAAPPPPPRIRKADEIDYEIFGEEMQYVVIELDPRETVIAEAGGMMFMTPEIKMETVFGDLSSSSGFFGKVMSAGKRLLTGESLFITTFTNNGGKKAQVAFASPYPGKIVPLHLDQLGGEMICQKDAFLCAAKGVQIGIAFQKKIGVGLFGGEGFIMQRLTGDGLALIHAGGTLMRRSLSAGEVLKIDTGCLVALQPSVEYDIQMLGGFKNTFFGGEGLFLATLTGPGDIWLQSLPFSRLAGRMLAGATTKKRDEGSLLGNFGGMLLGDGD